MALTWNTVCRRCGFPAWSYVPSSRPASICLFALGAIVLAACRGADRRSSRRNAAAGSCRQLEPLLNKSLTRWDMMILFGCSRC